MWNDGPCQHRYLDPMARKNIAMNETEILDFLASGRTLQVATHGPDGFPHLAPMWYIVEEGKVVFRTFTKSQKLVNLTRDPRLTVLVERGETYADLQGVMIKGRARLVTDRSSVLRLYGRITARYVIGGEAIEELTGDALEAAYGRYADKNTAVIVEPEHVISWDHTKLGGVY